MKIRFFIIFTVLLYLTGCGPKISEETPSGCIPNDIIVKPGNKMMEIAWKNDCPSLISGYNIYISKTPDGKEPFNATIFPGDTNPDDDIEHYIASGLESGVKYYVTVRTVFPNLTMSPPSEKLVTACGSRREIELFIRHKSEPDGFSFENDKYVKAGGLTNDIYFFSKDNLDYLSSPHRLDAFLRNSKFEILPYNGELNDIKSDVMLSKTEPSKDRVAVKVGEWVW